MGVVARFCDAGDGITPRRHGDITTLRQGLPVASGAQM
jgi:hypothetical protein